jgi:hypothetical protein
MCLGTRDDPPDVFFVLFEFEKALVEIDKHPEEAIDGGVGIHAVLAASVGLFVVKFTIAERSRFVRVLYPLR